MRSAFGFCSSTLADRLYGLASAYALLSAAPLRIATSSTACPASGALKDRVQAMPKFG